MTDNHKHAAIIEHLKTLLIRIKSLSGSGEIDRLTIEGNQKLFDLGESLGITKEIEMLRDRRIDPTN